MIKSDKPFTPILMMCGDCGHLLQSTYRGQYSACPEHGNAVDQTDLYSRYIGDVEIDRDAMAEVWEDTSEQSIRIEDGDIPSALAWFEEMEDSWGEDADCWLEDEDEDV
jgi:hypothetical protein